MSKWDQGQYSHHQEVKSILETSRTNAKGQFIQLVAYQPRSWSHVSFYVTLNKQGQTSKVLHHLKFKGDALRAYNTELINFKVLSNAIKTTQPQDPSPYDIRTRLLMYSSCHITRASAYQEIIKYDSQDIQEWAKMLLER